LSAPVQLGEAHAHPALEGLADDDLLGASGRFADDVWDLAPLLARRQKGERLSFSGVPIEFRQPVTEFAWRALSPERSLLTPISAAWTGQWRVML
jgi:hypothetical protein